MFETIKSHIINIVSITIMWWIAIGALIIFSAIGHGIILILKALNSGGWVYFWVSLGIALVPPFLLWIFWLRKHP